MLLCYYTWLHARALCRYRDVGSGGSSHVPAKSRFTSSAIRRSSSDIPPAVSCSSRASRSAVPLCAMRARTRARPSSVSASCCSSSSRWRSRSSASVRRRLRSSILEAFQLSVLLALLGHETGMLQTDLLHPDPQRHRGSAVARSTAVATVEERGTLPWDPLLERLAELVEGGLLHHGSRIVRTRSPCQQAHSWLRVGRVVKRLAS